MAEALTDFSLGKKIQPQGMIQKIGVVGCGTIGQELARTISEYGIDVVFIDTSNERVEEINNEIAAQLDEIIEKWGLTSGEKRAIMSRIKGTTDFNDLKDCDIVIEAIHSGSRTTSLNARRDLFRQIEAVIKEDAVIASNTATLMISDIASVLDKPERAIGLHFITPLYKVNVVEVVKGFYTNEQSFKQIEKFATMIGREVVSLNESPGNISTRMMAALINEACHILMEGVANVEDIDTTMRQASGHQFGPFEMADRIGLDKVLKYMENLYAEFGESKYKAAPIIKRLVRANYLGKSTGKGFYSYIDGKPVSHTIGFADIK
ncbi:MAG: 3-hydroxyacyl-CoA dehydrogenase family protein [Hyphomicrobiales bacterium]